MKKQNTGFSMVELAITLALAAIVVTMAAPSFSGFLKANRLTAATNEFTTSLRYTRTLALDKGNVSMVANTTGSWEDGWNVVDDTSGTVLRAFQPIGGTVTLTSANNIGTITFGSTGYLTTAADTVAVCDDSQNNETGRNISITLVGRVSVDSAFVCVP